MVFCFDDVSLAYAVGKFIHHSHVELLFMSIPLGDKTSTKFDTGDTAIPKLEYYLSIETDFLTRKEIFEPLTAVQKEIYFWTHRF